METMLIIYFLCLDDQLVRVLVTLDMLTLAMCLWSLTWCMTHQLLTPDPFHHLFLPLVFMSQWPMSLFTLTFYCGGNMRRREDVSVIVQNTASNRAQLTGNWFYLSAFVEVIPLKNNKRYTSELLYSFAAQLFVHCSVSALKAYSHCTLCCFHHQPFHCCPPPQLLSYSVFYLWPCCNHLEPNPSRQPVELKGPLL